MNASNDNQSSAARLGFAIEHLKGMRRSKQLEYDYWKTAKRRMKPSERAATLGSLQMDIDALGVVIANHLTGGQ